MTAPLSIVKRCKEDRSICFPTNKQCDKIADCPLGSDEADCSCADLDMQDCIIMETTVCLFPEWIIDDNINIPACQKKIKQGRVNQLVRWQYLGNLG